MCFDNIKYFLSNLESALKFQWGYMTEPGLNLGNNISLYNE